MANCLVNTATLSAEEIEYEAEKRVTKNTDCRMIVELFILEIFFLEKNMAVWIAKLISIRIV